MNHRALAFSALIVFFLGAFGFVAAQDASRDLTEHPKEITEGAGPKPNFDACVSNTQASCFPTIQDAVNSLGPGTEIVVKNGTYFENVVIPPGLDGLRMVGQINTVLDPDFPNAGPGIVVMADDVTIQGMTIKNGMDDGIKVMPGVTGTQLIHVDIMGSGGDCLDIDGGDTLISNANLLGCAFQAVDVDADDVTIEYGNFQRCGRGCIELNGDRGVIRKNTINVSDDGECIDIDGHDALVDDNDLRNCASDGIDVAGDNAVVKFNDIETCDVEGIDIFGDFASVTSNKVDACDSGGVSVFGADPSVVGNVVSHISGDDGFATGFSIDCTPCAAGEILNNDAENIADDCVGFDIFSDTPGSLLVDLNVVQRAGDTGYELSGEGILFTRNQTWDNGGDSEEAGIHVFGTGHTLDDNKSIGSHGDGIKVEGEGHTLTDNEVKDNLEDGIDVVAIDVLVIDCVVKDNAGIGIEISTGSTGVTLTDNLATGNRFDFCDDGAGTTRMGNTFGSEGVCAIDD